MFLQSHLYYKLRALVALAEDSSDPVECEEKFDLISKAAHSVFQVAEYTYINLLEFPNTPEDVWDCVSRCVELLDAMRDKDSVVWPNLHLLSEHLNNGGYAVMEAQGWDDPEGYCPSCLYRPGQGYLVTVYPCCCFEIPNKSWGIYTDWEYEAAQRVQCSNPDLQEMCFGYVKSYAMDSPEDWAMLHVIADDSQVQRDARANVIRLNWISLFSKSAE